MFVDQEIGVGSPQRAARTRNKAKTIFLFKSARPLGVPAFGMDRRISARLNAAACNNTRLATSPRPRTCSLRIPFCNAYCKYSSVRICLFINEGFAASFQGRDFSGFGSPDSNRDDRGATRR